MITDKFGKPMFSEQKKNSPMENWEGLKKIIQDNVAVGKKDLESFKKIADNQQRCHKQNVGKQGISIMMKVLDLMQRLEKGEIKVNIGDVKSQTSPLNSASTPLRSQA